MIQSRRTVFVRSFRPRDLVGSASHAGLWLDKFMPEQLPKGQRLGDRERSPNASLVEETAAIREPAEYVSFFERWQSALRDADAQTRVATVQGRMVVGMGTEGVLETSVTLHHTYGVPYIPGSALKGLAASYARQRLGPDWQAGSDAYLTLFGAMADAGYVTFFDALYVPHSGTLGSALHPDVLTVHHEKYYQGLPAAPADWDNPVPVPMLSATGKYLIALAGPPEWIEKGFDMLALALQNCGVGAKTSSGYGRLELAAAEIVTGTEVNATVRRLERHRYDLDLGGGRMGEMREKDAGAVPLAVGAVVKVRVDRVEGKRVFVVLAAARELSA